MSLRYIQTLRRFFQFAKTAPVESGVCCCGADMAQPHSDHTPKDQWDRCLETWEDSIAACQTPAPIAHLKQKFKHDPANGTWGDCHRTCMAMVLGQDRDSIPNFGELYGQGKAFNDTVQAYLAPFGLYEVGLPFGNESTVESIRQLMQNVNPGMPYILAGMSANGTNHSVVIDGARFLDPSLDGSSIVGPCDDGLYWIYFYAVKP